MATRTVIMRGGLCAAALALSPAGVRAQEAQTQLFWGDTHVHTSTSVDAYAVEDYFSGPEEAYRFARGIPILHTKLQTRVQIDRPLDFMVVADHAERMRLQVNILEQIPPLQGVPGLEEALEFVRSSPRQTMGALEQFLTPEMVAAVTSEETKAYSWNAQIEAAERNNVPGVFTAFAGWEWTRNPGGNLHRVVFTPDGPEVTRQFRPYSTDDGPNPEDLWTWLDETSQRTGARFVAIPHNSNLSNGTMFSDVDSEGRPIDADYARQRARWETVMEIAQVKGASEVDPVLSPEDEFAGFEIHRELLIGGIAEPNGADYARTALMRGLAFEETLGVNPFKVGFVGASDSHTSLSSVDEFNFWGKTVRDTLPAERLNVPPQQFFATWKMSAAGLAGVWAEENSREAIAAAFQRREVYGTSGPRIMLRVFGGFGFDAEDARAADIAAAGYAGGVPMGGDLTAAPGGAAPSLLIHAAKDPLSGHLDRIQVIKGWLGSDGVAREKVFDAAWSGDRAIGADGDLPPVGDTVDVTTALYENSIGAAQLATVWTDPEFDPAQRAFYYVRVLEIPTPRHSLYDAVALGVGAEETGQPATIQERAWSSPIWYTPAQ